MRSLTDRTPFLTPAISNNADLRRALVPLSLCNVEQFRTTILEVSLDFEELSDRFFSLVSGWGVEVEVHGFVAEEVGHDDFGLDSFCKDIGALDRLVVVALVKHEREPQRLI